MKKFLRVGEFVKNTGGNVALIFGLSSVAVIGVSGMAIDYSRSVDMETSVQAAADTAAIAVASSGLEGREAKRYARKVFNENFKDKNVVRRPRILINLKNPEKVVVRARVYMKPTFVSVLGWESLRVNVKSVAGRASGGAEVALVLDISGSMQASMGAQTRLAAMKSAAKLLVDKVSENGEAKIGVVPFTMNVNIGTKNGKYVTDKNHALFAGTSWKGCVFERKQPYHVSDEYDGSNNGAMGKWHAMIWPPMPNNKNQCINPSDGTNEKYAAVVENPAGVYKSQTAGPNFNCIRHSLMPLSKTASDVKNKIDSLTAESNQGTIIAPGISWGMRLLSPEEPFSEGNSYSKGTKKVIVVLTDGEQTTEAEYHSDSCQAQKNTTTKFEFDPAKFNLDGKKLSQFGPDDMMTPYGFIKDSDPFATKPASWRDVKSDLKDVSLAACDAAKAKNGKNAGIEIYSIAVSSSAGPGTDVYNLLRNCASSTDKFYYANDPAALDRAFTEISKSINKVRLVQ